MAVAALHFSKSNGSAPLWLAPFAPPFAEPRAKQLGLGVDSSKSPRQKPTRGRLMLHAGAIRQHGINNCHKSDLNEYCKRATSIMEYIYS